MRQKGKVVPQKVFSALCVERRRINGKTRLCGDASMRRNTECSYGYFLSLAAIQKCK